MKHPQQLPTNDRTAATDLNVLRRSARWRLQISLRTSIAMLTLLCIALSYLGTRAEQARRQERAIAAMPGVRAVYDYQRFPDSMLGYDLNALPPGPAIIRWAFGQHVFADVVCLDRSIDDAPEDSFNPTTFSRVRVLETLEEVELVPSEGAPVTDNDLADLGQLTRLKKLTIANSPVTDAGLRHLTGLVNLEELLLYNTQVRGEGLEFISRCPQLLVLDLNCDLMIADEFITLRHYRATALRGASPPPPVRNSALRNCSALPRLRFLRLDCEGVSGDNLRYLGNLKSLEYLCCAGIDIRLGDLQHLHALPNLSTLNLELAKLTDEALADISGLRQLRTLNLSNTAITDAGLKHLAGLTNLEHLQLSNTSVTARGLSQLSGLQGLKTLHWDEIPPRNLSHHERTTFPWSVHRY